MGPMITFKGREGGCLVLDYAMTVTRIVRFTIDRSINGKMDGGGFETRLILSNRRSIRDCNDSRLKYLG